MTQSIYKGAQVISLLNTQSEQHESMVLKVLEPLNPVDTLHKWHTVLRSIEELINLPLHDALKEQELRLILSVPTTMAKLMGNPQSLMSAYGLLNQKFGIGVANRFKNLVLMTSAFSQSYNSEASAKASVQLETMADGVGYYQSRRRYLVTFLTLIPRLAKGSRVIEEIQLLSEFLPVIEIHCVSKTSTNRHLLLAQIFDDFTLQYDGQLLLGSRDYQPLEKMFLEPERISIVDQTIQRKAQLVGYVKKEVDPTKIFSAVEIENSIALMEAAYTFYDIQSTEFKPLMEVVLKLIESCEDDYFITISVADFKAIISGQEGADEKKLLSLFSLESNEYTENLNSTHPLIRVEDTYVTNLNLLLRFLYHEKNRILEKKKRYQIHSGFVFEDMVKDVLKIKGFKIEDITRINRKEFDVVTTRDGVIHNFQCKNNAVDLTLIDQRPSSFIRYNRGLVRYYEKALVKEENREGLLLKKLKMQEAYHYVISRFPVISDNARIVSFNTLETWIDEKFPN
jgi:hypothetical protein